MADFVDTCHLRYRVRYGVRAMFGEGKPGEETGWFRDKEGKTTDKGGKPPKPAEMKDGGKMAGKWKKL